MLAPARPNTDDRHAGLRRRHATVLRRHDHRQGADPPTDPRGLQTFRALLQIAETFGSGLVAEGIETPAELRIVRDLDSQRDFVGHVGGDDFIMLFQNADWQQRCLRIVESFNRLARELFDADALAAGGIEAEDRHGVMRFHPLTTICIGAVQAEPGRFERPEDVASAAAAAKRHAKHGNLALHVLDR
jgi:hypothetical protein